MSQPPDQPPHDGFSSPRHPGGPPAQPPAQPAAPPPVPPQGPPPVPPQGPAQGGPPAPPPGPQSGYAYPQPPQQPYGPPNPYAQQSPYGQPAPYGQPNPYGAHLPPVPPEGGRSGSRGKVAAIIGGAVVVVLLICGGVYLAVRDGGGREPAAGATVSPSPSEEPTDDPLDDHGDDHDYEDDDDPVEPPPAQRDFKGQWKDGDRTLTIGAVLTSGEMKGRNLVFWTDREGDGVCLGFGEDQSRGFRLSVRCGMDDDAEYIAGTATKASDGESIRLSWDEGGTDTLDWAG